MSTGFNKVGSPLDESPEVENAGKVIVVKGATPDLTDPSVVDPIVKYIVDHGYVGSETKTEERFFKKGTVKLGLSTAGVMTITMPESVDAERIASELGKKHADEFTCKVVDGAGLKSMPSEAQFMNEDGDDGAIDNDFDVEAFSAKPGVLEIIPGGASVSFYDAVGAATGVVAMRRYEGMTEAIRKQFLGCDFEAVIDFENERVFIDPDGFNNGTNVMHSIIEDHPDKFTFAMGCKEGGDPATPQELQSNVMDHD